MDRSTKTIEKLPQKRENSIKDVLAIMSGKGGVGKSSLTGLLATGLSKRGYRVGVLDADITGPSIPRIFGLKEKPLIKENGISPVLTHREGMRIMSLNLLLPHEDDPVIWRGPIIANTVRQFWTDVIWGELDYLLVDLPPGTGDAPLTVMQQIPLTGIVVITSPQELAKMVVKKALKMAEALDVPVLGLVENMSSVLCPYCEKEFNVFGENRGAFDAEEMGISFLGSLPIDPELANHCDRGLLEEYEIEKLDGILPTLLHNIEERRR